VNQYTASYQILPAISHDSSGGFVVAWMSNGQGGSIFGRRFDSSGGALGAEFQVNQYTTSQQRGAAISHGSSGGFVVAWYGSGQDGNGYGVFGRRFNSSGGALGAEFQINAYTTGTQDLPAISHDSSGGFVVAWESNGQDGSNFGVFGRRFDSSGSAMGAEFQVNQYTTSHQRLPTISHDSSGGFVVAWQSFANQDGSGYGVFGRRFNSSGGALGAEFQINAYTTDQQRDPTISHDSSGGFVVAWNSISQDGSGWGVFGRRFNSSGGALGAEFQINAYTTDQQRDPTISHDSSGGFVVAWGSNGQDGSLYGVFARRFSPARLSINDIGASEGNSGTTNLLFTVTAAVPTDFEAEVSFDTADDTAMAGSDYTSTSGTVSIAAGDTQAMISVPVNGDTLYEHDESFFVQLSNPVWAIFTDPEGVGTIQNDDMPPELSIGDVTVIEGNAGSVQADFSVSISAASGVDTTVEFNTSDGTAEAGTDYTLASGTLLFPALSTTPQHAFVTVMGDTDFEQDEFFFNDLINPVDATIGIGTGVGTILNDDGNFLVVTGPASGGASLARSYQGE
jgi:hypothetical protein